MYTLQGHQGLAGLGCGATACAECKAKQGLGDDPAGDITSATDISSILPAGVDAHQVSDVVVYGFAAFTIWKLASSFFGGKVRRAQSRRKRISMAKESLKQARSMPLF